jgi:hypothetical protein
MGTYVSGGLAPKEVEIYFPTWQPLQSCKLTPAFYQLYPAINYLLVEMADAGKIDFVKLSCHR